MPKITRTRDHNLSEPTLPCDEPSLSRRQFLKVTGSACAGATGGLLYPGLISAESSIGVGAGYEYRNYLPEIMSYRRLGKTNMMVSSLSFGAAAGYGVRPYSGDDPVAYRAAIERALEKGINLFDTAEHYKTEADFAVLCKHANREKVFISTKVFPGRGGKTREVVENSLRIMGTDYIDLLIYPNVNPNKGHALRFLDIADELITEGKVRFKGWGGHSTDLLDEVLNKYGKRIDAILGFYNPSMECWEYKPGTPWNPLSSWEKLYSRAKAMDIGVIAIKVLFTPYKPISERESDLKSDTEGWARIKPLLDAGYTFPQACIRWTLLNKDVDTRLVGMRRIAEVEEDIDALKPLTLTS